MDRAVKRLHDWPERLAALMEAKRLLPFEWGSHDCCTFPADAVWALTGIDPMSDLRGAYATQRQAMQVILDHGGIKQMVTDRLCIDPVPSRHAKRGDIVHLEQAGLGARLGVIYGGGAVVPSLAGLHTLPIPRAASAWCIDF